MAPLTHKRIRYSGLCEPSASAVAGTIHPLTPSPSARSGAGNNNNPAGASRRRRINFACEYCRSRKTRCDEGHPSCHACLSAGIACVTKSRRQPWLDVRRHEAGKVTDRFRGDDETRQNEHVSSSLTRGVHDALETSVSGGRPTSASSRRRSGQQDQAYDTTIAREAIDPGSSHGYSQSQQSDALASQCNGNNRPPWIQHRLSDRAGATDNDDDRPELNARLPLIQIDSGSTSLELMINWLELARYRLRIARSGLRQPSQSGSHGSERLQSDSMLPIHLGTASLPSQEASMLLLECFLNGPNMLFPVLQPDKIKQAVQRASLQGPNSLAQEDGLTVLMQVYLVMILGQASRGKEPQFDAKGCLKYCESLLGLILQQNTVEALQAVALLSMTLRCYDKLAAAGHTMSLAVSMGVQMGLPRYCPRLPPGEERRNTWMGVFAFEKLLSFELGRSSLIPDDYPELLPDSSLRSHAVPHERADGAKTLSHRDLAQPICEAVLSLARVLGEVGRLCVQVSRKEDDRSDESMTEVIKEKVRTTGLSCLRLMEWASNICPSRYSPTADIFFDSKVQPFASFIAMQYHTALILVTRNSLLISEKALRLAVDVIAKNELWESVVRNGQSMAVNSARKVLRLFLECSDHEAGPALPGFAGPLHAMGVLAVFVATRPGLRTASMDRELLKATALAVKEQHTSSRVQNEVAFAFDQVEILVSSAVRPSHRGEVRSAQRSTAHSPKVLQEPTAKDQQQLVGTGFNPLRGVEESIGGQSSEQIRNMDEDCDLPYSEWWPEDDSPLIMDEFGWNLANFSQLLDSYVIE